MGRKFDKHSLAVEQNNYASKIVNACTVYELDAWPRNPTNNVKFKNCLFGASSVVKKSDKEKYAYSGYGLTFHSAGSWNFDKDTAINVKIFSADNGSSSHTDNR